MVTVPGSWKSLEELEDSVTLDEIMNILSKSREMRGQEREFMASINDKTLERSSSNGEYEDPVERAARRAQERILQEQEGMPQTSEDFDLSEELGITFRTE